MMFVCLVLLLFCCCFNFFSVSRKIAIITGGSRGLGANAALKLAASGWNVILTYKSNVDEANKVVAGVEKAGGKGAALPLDVAHVSTFQSFTDQVKATLKSWGVEKFDHLVNNAGIGGRTPVGQTSEKDFDELMNIHLKAPIFLTQSLLPIMNDGGRILNVSTGLARFSSPGMGVYAAMKGAIETYTRYQALELGPRKITANVIAPGAIETDFGGGHVRDNENLNKMIASQTALGRVGVPDDIGGAIVAMLSDNMRWMNGQRVEFSGGIHL